MSNVLQIRISDEKKEAYKKSVPSMSADLHKHIDKVIKKTYAINEKLEKEK